jgi:hypothetical protein
MAVFSGEISGKKRAHFGPGFCEPDIFSCKNSIILVAKHGKFLYNDVKNKRTQAVGAY